MELQMSQYKLKGIVNEIKVEEKKYQIKLTGTTGYSVKINNDECNLFIPENTPKSHKTSVNSLTVNDLGRALLINKNTFIEYDIEPDNDLLINLLTSCYANNKPIEVVINEDLSDKDNPKYKLTSITALSN